MSTLTAAGASHRALVVGEIILVLLVIAVGVGIMLLGLAAIWWPLGKIVDAFEKQRGLASLVIAAELAIFAIGYITAARPMMIVAGIVVAVTIILGMMADANRG